MKLPADFERRLGEKSAEELCGILANAGDYLPEAVEAARAELGRRRLPERNVTSLVDLAAARRANEETEYKEGPLDPRMRALVLIFGLWVGIAFCIYYRGKGCTKKARQSLIWIFYHFLLALSLAIFVSILASLRANG